MCTVLVVDDDPTVLAVLSRQLRDLGHEVVATGNPEHAISLVEDGKATPELAVVEVSMPEMTGFELAQILHEHQTTRRLPVLFFSDVIEQSASFTEDGVTARYVAKSDLTAELPAAVRELVQEPVPAR